MKLSEAVELAMDIAAEVPAPKASQLPVAE